MTKLINKPSVVITGTSTGIGYSAAKYLVSKGYHVFGSVRNESDASKLSNEINDNFTPLIMDVTDKEAILKSVEIVSEHIANNNLTALINNAGIVVPGPLKDISIERFRYQFEVNVVGALQVTQAFLPLLGARKDNTQKPGKVIMISSISGRLTFPFVGPYNASKHALEALSKVLRYELMYYNIPVSVIRPGNTDTPIWVKSSISDEYKKSDYYPLLENVKNRILSMKPSEMIRAEEIAKVIMEIIINPKPKDTYLIMKGKLMGFYLPRIIPDWIIRKIISKVLNLKAPK